jgi:hypothetical protein
MLIKVWLFRLELRDCHMHCVSEWKVGHVLSHDHEESFSDMVHLYFFFRAAVSRVISFNHIAIFKEKIMFFVVTTPSEEPPPPGLHREVYNHVQEICILGVVNIHCPWFYLPFGCFATVPNRFMTQTTKSVCPCFRDFR